MTPALIFFLTVPGKLISVEIVVNNLFLSYYKHLYVDVKRRESPFLFCEEIKESVDRR